jgi:hypothetical protein
MPASRVVIPDSAAVTPDPATVIPDSIRDPVLRHHWIAGQARNDKSAVIPDSIRDPVLRQHWIAGAETPDPGSSPGQALIRGRNDKSVVTPSLIRARNDSAAFDLIGIVMNFRNINRPPFFKAARQ